MRRVLCILLALCCLLPLAAQAEDSLTLLTADTVDEVNQFVLLPQGTEIPAPQAGSIRFVSLNSTDPAFRAGMWKNDRYDLTTKAGGYRADMNNLHSRAAYCMAMSYLGVDVTPVMMSELAGARDVSAPYDGVTRKLGKVERVEPRAYVFDTMVENYLTDPSYSPVYVYLRRPDGKTHALLIIGVIPDTGRYIVLDPSGMWANGVQYRIYMMSFNKSRRQVLNSTFRKEYTGSEILALYQWRLVEEE